MQDERKGEQLVLVTEHQATREDLSTHLRAAGYTEVSIPKKILAVAKLPLLGFRKTDYPTVGIIGGDRSVRK